MLLIEIKTFLIISSLICPVLSEEPIQTIYVRGLRCNISEAFVYKNFSCFPKSYSRTVSTMNVVATFVKPLTDFFIETKIFFKYGMIYREVIHTPRVEWCPLMNDYAHPQIIKSPLAMVLQLVSRSAPSAIHECPYNGFHVRNATVKTSSNVSIFPRGEYKTIFYLTDRTERHIMVINIIGDLNSTYTETFG